MPVERVGLYHDKRKRLPWIVRWFGEYDPETGKLRRYSRSFARKQRAVTFQASKQAEFDKGGVRDRPADVTVGEFCRKYVERRSHEWSGKTLEHVDDVCNRLLSHFGKDTKLRMITPDRAMRFWAEAKRVRTPQKKGRNGKEAGEQEPQQPVELSRSSRNCLLRYLKTMFKYAVC